VIRFIVIDRAKIVQLLTLTLLKIVKIHGDNLSLIGYKYSKICDFYNPSGAHEGINATKLLLFIPS